MQIDNTKRDTEQKLMLKRKLMPTPPRMDMFETDGEIMSIKRKKKGTRYTNYGTICAMSEDSWKKYMEQCKVLFEALKYDDFELMFFNPKHFACTRESLPKYSVYFNGGVCAACEWFFVSSEMLKGEQVSTETDELPYDFAVKCAMILLTEMGGMKDVKCDESRRWSMSEWLGPLKWLVRQPNLPNAYPRFKRYVKLDVDANYKKFRDTTYKQFCK